MWLTVRDPNPTGGARVDTLWMRDMRTQFQPRAGDKIHISVSEDGDDDFKWTVYSCYWSHNGRYNLNLSQMLIDEPGNSYLVTRSDDFARSWPTDVYGRPEEMLRRGGWITYEELERIHGN
jgi:hypothetical protein